MALRKEKRQALQIKDEASERILGKLYNTATAIFKWHIVENKYINRLLNNEIERLLFTQGKCTLFYDEKIGILKVGMVVNRASLGSYRQIVKWDAVMANGEKYYGLNDSNAVIIYNNKKAIPTFELINDEIERMVNIDVALNMHINALKVPFVFAGKESEMLTFKSLYESIAGGEPVVYLDRNIVGVGEVPFQVANTDIEYKGDKIVDLYEKIENRAYQVFGIQANYIDKKAQVNTTEVNKNDDVILIGFDALKSERENAVEIFNELFKDKGMSISLEINEFLTKQRGENDEQDLERQSKTQDEA